MPIYEYRCKKCNNKFDILVRDNKIVKCPTCGSSKLEKMLSNFCTIGGSSSCGNCSDDSSCSYCSKLK